MNKQNISLVASSKLCSTCGGCYAVCPVRAIKYQETVGGYCLPVVDEETCNHCGLCWDVCPGIHFGETLASSMPDDPFVGAVQNAFVGKATAKKFFDNSQSGGIVSALLAHALETGIINSAVTVAMEKGNPPRPMVMISKSFQEIYYSQKSKYCPVPVLGFFRRLRENDAPIAIVAISCQIHGLYNILDKLPKLRNKIVFTIGLVCDRVLTYAALDCLIVKSAIKRDAPLGFHFRDKMPSGYPGDVHVFSDNGTAKIMPATARIQIKDYFTPARCRLCFDKMNVFSDITVGDPHGLSNVDRKRGASMLLVRTEKGMEVVDSAINSKDIDIRPVAYKEVLKGQKIEKKREQWRGYVEAWKETGRCLPDFYKQVQKYTPTLINRNGYIADLDYSLKLDNFSSRGNLIAYVEKDLKRKKMLNRIFYPIRIGKLIVKKFLFSTFQQKFRNL